MKTPQQEAVYAGARAGEVGEKVVKQGKLPNRKLLGSKQAGEKVAKQGKLPNGRQYMQEPEQGRQGRKWWNE